MEQAFARTKMVIGEEGFQQLVNATVAVFGVGGVGSYVVEGLARSGIGTLILIDNDTICVTNINRQIPATVDTIGMLKVKVMSDRVKSINPNINVIMHQTFILPDNLDRIFDRKIDYIVDAIDTVTAKIGLVLKAKELNIPIIASMGTGNKLNPAELQVADIYETSICPLCKVMRKELKKRNIEKLKVVYSQEEPIKTDSMFNIQCGIDCNICKKEKEDTDIVQIKKRSTPGSVSFVPSVAGMIIASEVIKELM